eukprot:5035914-Pyramimonas_sp.AAC.1
MPVLLPPEDQPGRGFPCRYLAEDLVDDSSGFVYPAMQVLPMGWSWAFWFVQRLHIEVDRRSGVPSGMVATGSWPHPSVTEAPIEA